MDINVLFTYGFLLMGVISIWCNIKLFKRIPLWLFFTILSFVLALIFERASIISVIYTIVLGIVTYYYYQKKKILLFFFILLLSIPLMLHLSFTGFKNYRYLHNIMLSPNSVPYSLYFNLDKTVIGIFIIALGFQCKKIAFPDILKQLGIHLSIMVLVFFVLATVLGYSKFEPKFPEFTFVWMLVNLFFTCLAEEAIFRRLIQQKIQDSLPTNKYAPIISIGIASVLFGLAHFNGGIMYILLASVAGMFYGYIYHKTKRIESSMLLHFSFNLIHLLLFTYPALQ